jgi:hypothetical protein
VLGELVAQIVKRCRGERIDAAEQMVGGDALVEVMK